MGKHTPGPWIWGENYGGLYGAGPDNEVLSHASYEGMWLGYGPSREANGRLIAVAPDLLAAAKAAMQCIGELPPTQARVEVAQMLTAAIAAAEGGA